MKYIIRGLYKYAEQDSFADGCLPDTAFDHSIDINFCAPTIADVIAEACRFVDAEDDAVERDACGDRGRVDIAVLENAAGQRLSGHEIPLWKVGKMDAWYVVYTGFVEKIERVSVAKGA